ncbi:hypothetical protein [Asticcacaulis sp. YBE204]|uniref:hypothetical protein n=1 Tax=Asticcacaulis sp. YBE204 TaxID=1282363 RepID=UPI0003C3D056|nr:hypothetical protein [Asticcacaulis sp. YBE204]ESQ79395.1 hypothetical protein AEYBE204_10320 [Asticcacaulis sp. YBE204]
MTSKEISIQVLRQVISNGETGNYTCAPEIGVDLATWSWQAKELETFAKSKGYKAQSHPTAIGGGDLVDLLVVRI